MVVRLFPVNRAILVTEKAEFSFKSLTSVLNFLVMTVFLPLYLPAFLAAKIPCFCHSFLRSFSKVARADRLSAINLFVAKSVEYGRSKATKVIDLQKVCLAISKNLKCLDYTDQVLSPLTNHFLSTRFQSDYRKRDDFE